MWRAFDALEADPFAGDGGAQPTHMCLQDDAVFRFVGAGVAAIWAVCRFTILSDDAWLPFPSSLSQRRRMRRTRRHGLAWLLRWGRVWLARVGVVAVEAAVAALVLLVYFAGETQDLAASWVRLTTRLPRQIPIEHSLGDLHWAPLPPFLPLLPFLPDPVSPWLDVVRLYHLLVALAPSLLAATFLAAAAHVTSAGLIHAVLTGPVRAEQLLRGIPCSLRPPTRNSSGVVWTEVLPAEADRYESAIQHRLQRAPKTEEEAEEDVELPFNPRDLWLAGGPRVYDPLTLGLGAAQVDGFTVRFVGLTQAPPGSLTQFLAHWQPWQSLQSGDIGWTTVAATHTPVSPEDALLLWQRRLLAGEAMLYAGHVSPGGYHPLPLWRALGREQMLEDLEAAVSGSREDRAEILEDPSGTRVQALVWTATGVIDALTILTHTASVAVMAPSAAAHKSARARRGGLWLPPALAPAEETPEEEPATSWLSRTLCCQCGRRFLHRVGAWLRRWLWEWAPVDPVVEQAQWLRRSGLRQESVRESRRAKRERQAAIGARTGLDKTSSLPITEEAVEDEALLAEERELGDVRHTSREERAADGLAGLAARAEVSTAAWGQWVRQTAREALRKALRQPLQRHPRLRRALKWLDMPLPAGRGRAAEDGLGTGWDSDGGDDEEGESKEVEVEEVGPVERALGGDEARGRRRRSRSRSGIPRHRSSVLEASRGSETSFLSGAGSAFSHSRFTLAGSRLSSGSAARIRRRGGPRGSTGASTAGGGMNGSTLTMGGPTEMGSFAWSERPSQWGAGGETLAYPSNTPGAAGIWASDSVSLQSNRPLDEMATFEEWSAEDEPTWDEASEDALRVVRALLAGGRSDGEDRTDQAVAAARAHRALGVPEPPGWLSNLLRRALYRTPAAKSAALLWDAGAVERCCHILTSLLLAAHPSGGGADPAGAAACLTPTVLSSLLALHAALRRYCLSPAFRGHARPIFEREGRLWLARRRGPLRLLRVTHRCILRICQQFGDQVAEEVALPAPLRHLLERLLGVKLRARHGRPVVLSHAGVATAAAGGGRSKGDRRRPAGPAARTPYGQSYLSQGPSSSSASVLARAGSSLARQSSAMPASGPGALRTLPSGSSETSGFLGSTLGLSASGGGGGGGGGGFGGEESMLDGSTWLGGEERPPEPFVVAEVPPPPEREGPWGMPRVWEWGEALLDGAVGLLDRLRRKDTGERGEREGRVGFAPFPAGEEGRGTDDFERFLDETVDSLAPAPPAPSTGAAALDRRGIVRLPDRDEDEEGGERELSFGTPFAPSAVRSGSPPLPLGPRRVDEDGVDADDPFAPPAPPAPPMPAPLGLGRWTGLDADEEAADIEDEVVFRRHRFGGGAMETKSRDEEDEKSTDGEEDEYAEPPAPARLPPTPSTGGRSGARRRIPRGMR